MLILARRLDEKVVIRGGGLDAPITIMVTGIGGGRVKLGFEADKDVLILRGEVDVAPVSQEAAAGATSPKGLLHG